LSLAAIAGAGGWLTLTLRGGLAEDAQPVHWDYYTDGGAEAWGSLMEPGSDALAFPDCNLSQQSPIDVPRRAPVSTELRLDYRPTPLVVVNNGHTVEVTYAPGSTLSFDGKTYALRQFHFHSPSEHLVHGQDSPLEAHFVHQAADGELAVIGVLIEAGSPNAAFEQVLDVMPVHEGRVHSSDVIDAAGFMPADLAHYAYDGSLTTPPCSEGVRWKLLRQPITASEEQIARFRALPALNHDGVFTGNARPVQPLNGRLGSPIETPPIQPPNTGSAGFKTAD
jgi:carbonic anhydrase